MENFVPLAELIGFKGINADFIEELLPNADNPVYLTGGDNILIRGGKVEKMRGLGLLNSITAPRGIGDQRRILSLNIYENYDQYKRLIAFTPGQVEYLSSDSGWSDFGALDGTDESIVSFANIDNKCVFTLNDDPIIRSWDGMSFSDLVDRDLLRSRFLMKHKIWLLLARPLQYVDSEWVERYQEIWTSYPGVPGTFEEEDRLMIDADGAINGCRSLEESPIIYFPGSIHRVYMISDTEGFGSMPVAEDEGLLCPKTLTGGAGKHFFMTKRGMCAMRLGTPPAPLSWMKFNKLIIDGIDPVHYNKAIARFYEDTALLYIAFPPAGSADNGTLLIYDTVENELVGKRELTARVYSAMGSFEKDLTDLTPDERRNYGVGGIPIVGTSDGYVLEQKYSNYQFVNENFVSSMELPPIFFGDRHRNKRLMQADLVIEKLSGSDITFELEVANEANVVSSTAYTVTGDGGAGIRRYPIHIDIFGKEFRPVLRDKDNPYGYKIHGLIFRGYVSTLK